MNPRIAALLNLLLGLSIATAIITIIFWISVGPPDTTTFIWGIVLGFLFAIFAIVVYISIEYTIPEED